MPASYLPGVMDYLRFLPEIALSIFGIVIMLLEATMRPGDKRSSLGVVALVGLTVAFLANLWAAGNRGAAFSDMIFVDEYGSFFRGLVLVVGFLCVLASFSYLQR